MKDSLFNNTTFSSTYKIKVIDTLNNYTLLYSAEPGGTSLDTKASSDGVDSAMNFLIWIVKKVEKDLSSFRYELLVDKRSGQAIRVKNGSEFTKTIERSALSVIEELGGMKAKSASAIDSVKRVVVAYFKKAEPKLLETAVNGFNYIVQPYTYEFPYDGTISQKTMVRDINEMGSLADTEIPAMVKITSRRQGNNLTIETDTDYDKEVLLAELKKTRKNLSAVTASDFVVTEKVETVFSMNNGWLLSHKSSVLFHMKEVRVVNESIVTFE